ncbi:hypothetical protein PGQ11_013766 [Apiospora arundinis]|uniref:Uncharacterized protein n=1 Tax=Apiospora arundinis TaxID=335852 RepID=A0ABR2HQC2_9PEZI
MLWQRVVFLLGLAPNLGLTAKLPNLPILGRQSLGISVTDEQTLAGGNVVIAQKSADGGPNVSLLQATMTVPNLTFASGQGSTGGPYQLSVACGISGTATDSSLPCNNLGPRVGIHANLSSDGTMTYEPWMRWTLAGDTPLSADRVQALNLTTGDSVFAEIYLNSSSTAFFSLTNLKNTDSPVAWNWSTTNQDICYGDATTIYAGCALEVLDPSTMPGFVELDFESIFVYDRYNTTHDFDLDQQVQFYRMVKNGKLYAMPMIEEPRDFAVQWSENPAYGVGEGSDS